jgi:hypothetical protein
MAEERRFDEEEVARILERATSPETRVTAGPGRAVGGLTLPELQEIGSEVGIQPARIADAARDVGRRAGAVRDRTVMGVPRSVDRAVILDRALTDEEWTRLVVDLRETFGVEGTINAHGNLRSWSNGKTDSVKVHVEPHGGRYRVRMSTLNGDAFALASLGAGAVGVAGIFMTWALMGPAGAPPPGFAGAFGAIGLLQIGYIRALLPRWARKRAGQMEGITERIPRLLDVSAPAPLSPPDESGR